MSIPDCAAPDFKLDEGTKRALLERFIEFVKVDTQSSEESKAHPSTECQWDLLKLLQRKLGEMDLKDIHLGEKGYLYATLPSNLPAGRTAPVLGLIAHVDTSPAVSGKDVRPQIIENYCGGDITLPGNPEIVLKPEEYPNLQKCVGDTLITSDGTTLLGADDKAGIAAILTAVAWLQAHPEIPHGKIRVGFSSDEEVGRGTEGFDVALFGADVGYTLDGSNLGEIEDETFCGDGGNVTFTGADCHPGFAKGKLKSAVRAAAYFVDNLPEDHLPETTEGRESYLHPYTISGDCSKVTIHMIVRSFDVAGLEERKQSLEKVLQKTREKFPGVTCASDITKSYRNMKEILDKNPEVMELATEAVKRAGLVPVRHSIRGGTDGANLSFMGLPTPNIFAGGQNFHSHKEWVSLEWMAKSVETTLHIAHLWAHMEKR